MHTADLNTANLHWNSIICTALARYMCIDIKNFYLMVALEYFKYMKMPLNLSTEWIVRQCNLCQHALQGFIYLEMQQVVWGLPQACILANKGLCRKLAPFGYYKSTHTTGLWHHKTQPITFTLVVDNFGINYVNKDNVEHLIARIEKDSSLTKDWTGDLYCEIQLD